MTITLFSGTPGSGKSYHACRCIRDTLKYKKRDVIANFGVVVDEDWAGNFTYRPNSDLSVDYLVSVAAYTWASRPFKEDGILLVIDECQLLFNSRTWSDKDRMKWLQFFSQHRKYGYKVIFIAQNDVMVDKQFRVLIEYEVNHRKLGNYGLFGFILKCVLLGEYFMCVKYYYGLSERLESNLIRYSKKVASMYNSYTAFETAADAQAAGAVPRLVESLK